MIFLIAIIITLGVLFVVLWLGGDDTKRIAERDRELRRIMENPLSKVEYLTGHPNLNHSVCFNIEVQDNHIHFFDLDNTFAATINGQFIREVSVFDKSVYQEKVTLGRVALFGVLAFVAPKREKRTIYHLVITWQDQQFTHHTVLEYRGYEPLQRANNARNMLIGALKNSSSAL